jgi:hypothetical protein
MEAIQAQPKQPAHTSIRDSSQPNYIELIDNLEIRMDQSIKAMESKIMNSIKASKTPPDNTRVDAQARENTLKTMAYELEQKFVFVLGSANKAKKLPHVSTPRIPRETGSQMENSPQIAAACPTSPNPVDVLDILQALSK